MNKSEITVAMLTQATGMAAVIYLPLLEKI